MTFENYIGRDFVMPGLPTIYRFMKLSYFVSSMNTPSTIEVVGEVNEEGVIFAMRDADTVMAEIENGEMIEVAA